MPETEKVDEPRVHGAPSHIRGIQLYLVGQVEQPLALRQPVLDLERPVYVHLHLLHPPRAVVDHVEGVQEARADLRNVPDPRLSHDLAAVENLNNVSDNDNAWLRRKAKRKG